MIRKDIESEIRYLMNEAQITRSECLSLLADMVEGKYIRPEIKM